MFHYSAMPRSQSFGIISPETSSLNNKTLSGLRSRWSTTLLSLLLPCMKIRASISFLAIPLTYASVKVIPSLFIFLFKAYKLPQGANCMTCRRDIFPLCNFYALRAYDSTMYGCAISFTRSNSFSQYSAVSVPSSIYSLTA